MSTINAKIKLRRDTASRWTSANPVLLEGEVGIETDTLKAKVGDGSTAWNSLVYAWETVADCRPASNGNYIRSAYTVAQNLGALDTQAKTNADNIADKVDKTSADYIKAASISGKTLTLTKGNGDIVAFTETDTTYSAGDGLEANGTEFKVKAGTNVTVDSGGVSVTGNGSVASGNTGLISGGTAYTELRPAADGAFVKTAVTTAANLKELDIGVADAQNAVRILLNYARWNKWDIDDIKQWITKQGTFETGTVAMTNTLAFPFNDSQQSVSLAQSRNTTNYIVLTEVTAFSGNVGEVEVSDKLVNGFKIAYTGSAPSATIKYTVIGGFE